MVDEASAPPPTWMNTASIRTPPHFWRAQGRNADTISHATVLPPSIVRPLSLPWQQNGTAPSVTAARNVA